MAKYIGVYGNVPQSSECLHFWDSCITVCALNVMKIICASHSQPTYDMDGALAQ